MMYTCVTAGCCSPGYRHGMGLAARKPAARSKTVKRAAAPKRVAPSGSRAPRIDIHCHYHNREAAAKVAHLNPTQYEPSAKFANALTREVNVKQMQDRAEKLTSIETRLADMDRMGIDIQAVSPAPFQCYYWTEPKLGAELARMVNDRIAEIAATWPERFVGLGTVPLQNAELAVAELERITKLGLRGVEINPNVNGLDLTDPRLGLEPFFARAEALGAVVFLHPIGFTEGTRLVDHYFNNVIGNPMETTIAASHLIFDGVMERYPKLKVVLPHAGGYLAHYWARMDHAWRARADCRTKIARPPSRSLEKFYFDTIAFDPRMLRHMIDRYGPRQILLGTDYPYDMGVEDPVGFIGRVTGLPRADREMIEGGNAARLLKVGRPRGR